LHQALLTGMLSVQAVPPRIRPSQEWAQLLSQALIDGAIVSSWCHPRVLAGERLPSWSGLITVPLGMLPLQLVSHPPATASDSAPRKVLLPRRNVTPLLHEALAWHGFQVEQQPISCQDVPSWLKRMHDRQLAMPLCPGLVDPGWIQNQNLVPHPEQPHLMEQLWLLLPQGISGAIKRRVGIAPFQELCKFRVPTLDGAMVTGNLWCESLAGCSARMGDRLGCRPSSASCSTESPASGSSASA
jgi:hypothetical protein